MDMSESLYDVNLILELTISVNAKTIEEAEGKIAELSDAELLSFVQERHDRPSSAVPRPLLLRAGGQKSMSLS